MKKWMFVIAGLAFVLVVTGCGGKKSFSMDQVDTRAYVMPDGDLYVEELFTYTFHGSFNGTTRYIEPGEHEGIEFFEAYQPPPGKKLGEFSYENLSSLNTEWDGENDTYYIHDAAKDEVKQVYYRYRIDQAAVRYSDVGKLDFSFFKNSNQDIHHVSVDLYLPSEYNKTDVYGFLHDRTGGELTTGGESALHYENDRLSEYGDAEIVMLFPPNQLPQMKVSQKEKSFKQLLATEQKREARMQLRDERMQWAGKVAAALTIVFLLGAVMYLLSWRRISAWLNRKQVSRDELALLDPLLKTYLYRKSKLTQKDFIAGLLSLRNRGFVTVKEVPSSARFLEEPTAPDTTLLFTFQGDAGLLSPAEQQLVDWLFKDKNGGREFRLDSVAGPTFKEKQNDELIVKYRKASERHAAAFKQWKKAVSDTDPYADEVKPNMLLKFLVPVTVIVHYGLLLYLFYADVAASLSIVLIAVLLGAGGILASIKYTSKLWILLYHVACFVIGSQIVHEDGSSSYLILVISSALFAALIPKYSMSWKTQQYRFALKDWGKELRKGPAAGGTQADRAEGERDAEHAVLLGIIPQYVKRLRTGQEDGAVYAAAAIPLLFSADILASMQYTQTHLGILSSGSSSSGSSAGYSGGGGGGGGTGAF